MKKNKYDLRLITMIVITFVTQILSLLITLTYVITLSLGIWIGVGLGEKRVYQETQPWKNTILRSDPVMDVNSSGYLSDSEAYQSTVFGSPYRRDQISSVTFLDTLAACPSDAWDVSEGRNRSVMAWVKPNGEQFDLYIGARGGVSAGMSCETLFAGYKNAVKITFGGAFHTENVKTMDRMFYHCRSLTTLELDDQFNTSKVRDMNMMFYGCESLSMLSLGDCFDTSQVSNMHSMFSYCNSLDALYLSDCFVTTNANTHNMFFLCPAVESYQHLLN